MTISINQRGQEDLTKIIFDRERRLPTHTSSQSAAAYWVETLPDRVGADSLVSRLNNGHRVHIGDFDMRKVTAPHHPRRLRQTVRADAPLGSVPTTGNTTVPSPQSPQNTGTKNSHLARDHRYSLDVARCTSPAMPCDCIRMDLYDKAKGVYLGGSTFTAG